MSKSKDTGAAFDAMRLYDEGFAFPVGGDKVEDRTASKDQQEHIQGFAELGEVLRTHWENTADSRDNQFDPMWHRIQEQLTAVTPHKPKQSFWQRKWPVWSYVGGMAAMAAACFMFLSMNSTTTKGASTIAGSGMSEKSGQQALVGTSPKASVVASASPDVTDSMILATKQAQPNTEVEQLEVDNGSGSIFQVPGDDEGTTIIWISEEELEEATEGTL